MDNHYISVSFSIFIFHGYLFISTVNSIVDIYKRNKKKLRMIHLLLTNI